MPFDVRLLVISLATFAVAGAVTALGVPWLARRAAAAGSPHVRAVSLFRVRLLPVIVALLAMTQGVVSFVVFEPRGGDETFGRVLLGLAAIAVGLVAFGTVQLTRAALDTRRAMRRWLSTASPISLEGIEIPSYAIDTPFPLVAVVGIIRPRLVIARLVLDQCTPDELRAVLAHERQHIIHRDNLRRAVLLWLPDALTLFPAGRRVIAMWRDTSEAIADEGATALGPTGRVNLASALLRVARLAPAGLETMRIPASALYRGEDISDRVRRLLDPPATPPVTRLTAWRRAMMGAGLVAGGGLALHAVHEIVEAAVSYLP